jgi:prepilin-type N-terminal cleavage/methylation domain-containing protein
MKRHTGLGQAGDTLVEVLISILIVSMILTGAYVTTNRSSLGIRNSQEHSEALKLVQSQLEQVRQNASQPAPNVFDQPVGPSFCMVNGSIVTIAAPCKQDSGANAATVQPAYQLTVQRQSCSPYVSPAGTTCHKFVVSAKWESVTASDTNTEMIAYRLYR